MSDWNQDMSAAPRDGTKIAVRSVWGNEPDDSEICCECEAQWRTERREGLGPDFLGRPEDGLSDPYDDTGWMRTGSPYRVPGRLVSWKDLR